MALMIFSLIEDLSGSDMLEHFKAGPSKSSAQLALALGGVIGRMDPVAATALTTSMTSSLGSVYANLRESSPASGMETISPTNCKLSNARVGTVCSEEGAGKT